MLRPQVRIDGVGTPGAHRSGAGLDTVEAGRARCSAVRTCKRPVLPRDRLTLHAVAPLRKVGKVQLIDHRRKAHTALHHGHACFRAGVAGGQNLGVAAQQQRRDAEAQLTELTPLLTQVQTDLAEGLQIAALLVAAVVVVNLEDAARDLRGAGHEPVVADAAGPIQRVVQLGECQRHVANLYAVAPLGSVGVQPMPVVTDLDVETAVAPEVGAHVQTHAKVMRAPGLVFQIENQTVAVGRADDFEIGAGVVAAGCQAARIAFGHGFVELDAHLGLKLRRVALR